MTSHDSIRPQSTIQMQVPAFQGRLGTQSRMLNAATLTTSSQTWSRSTLSTGPEKRTYCTTWLAVAA
jgi:hypothetical protein